MTSTTGVRKKGKAVKKGSEGRKRTTPADRGIEQEKPLEKLTLVELFKKYKVGP